MKKTDIFNGFNYMSALFLAIVISGFWTVEDTFINRCILGFLAFMIILAIYINYQLNNPLEMDDYYNEDDDE